MRSFEAKLAACAGAGLAVAGLLVGYAEVQSDFDPAYVRQQQVDACAPYMPVKEQTNAPDLPMQCRPFADDLVVSPYVASQGLVYDLPAQKDFVHRFTPDAHYNRDQFLEWAEAGGFWGLLIMSAGLLATNKIPSKNNGSNQPKPGQQLSIREYRRRYASSANSLPPDNMSNGDLRWFIAQAIERQRSAEN